MSLSETSSALCVTLVKVIKKTFYVIKVKLLSDVSNHFFFLIKNFRAKISKISTDLIVCWNRAFYGGVHCYLADGKKYINLIAMRVIEYLSKLRMAFSAFWWQSEIERAPWHCGCYGRHTPALYGVCVDTERWCYCSFEGSSTVFDLEINADEINP